MLLFPYHFHKGEQLFIDFPFLPWLTKLVHIHVMAQIFKSGDLSNLIRSFDSISGSFFYPKYSDTASIVDQDQTAPKDCSRSALFASTFIKHSLIPQKNLFKFENGKVH